MLPKDLLDINPDFAKELGVDPGFDSEAEVLVIVGSNASGKSFLRRLFSHTLKKEHGLEVISLSHEMRCGSGLQRLFVYGDEAWQSTGAISAQTFISGVNTMRGRKAPHVVIWDEPEIGMGEELQAGSADWLFSEVEREWPEHLVGIIVMTHSRAWVSRAMLHPKSRFLSLDGHKTAKGWLGRKIKPVNPAELSRMAMDKFRRLNGMLKEK